MARKMLVFGCNPKEAGEMTKENVSSVRRELAGLMAAVALDPGKYPMGKIRQKAAERNLAESGIGSTLRARKMMRRVA